MGSLQKLDMLNTFHELESLTCQRANQQLSSPEPCGCAGLHSWREAQEVSVSIPQPWRRISLLSCPQNNKLQIKGR